MNLELIWHNLREMLSFNPNDPMIFASGIFWVLFLLFLPLYACLKNRRTMMVVFVVIFSLLFYYKSSGWFVLMLVLTSVIDWWASKSMVQCTSKWSRRVFLILPMVLSIGILLYFKYANFFLWNWNQMVEGNFQPLDIVLPVGISFYTFQSISYIVDVYKGKIQPTKTWLDYAFFLTFFPQLVAGPIMRADYFIPQIYENRHASRQEMWAGVWLIILGLIKKSIIADYLAQYNDLVFNNPGGYSGFETLMGLCGYSMQIYGDFSGYSDMAIGIAAIMGFKLAPNFNFPYKATNLSDFWRRWHISLSTWLKDYIYIPLGGNRKGTFRTYLNNFLTMLIAGFWHGAAWKFVVWGGLHGIGLAVHKACQPWLKKLPDNWLIKALAWTVTMLYIALLWAYFRAADWHDSMILLDTVFTKFSFDYVWPFVQARWMWVILMAVIITAHSLPTSWWGKAGDWFVASPIWVKAIIFTVVVQLIVEFRTEDVSPFIYFQF